jgi:hypothetical protein
MITEMRDAQFASYVDAVVDSVSFPSATFSFRPGKALLDVVSAFYRAFATPDRATLRHALRGVAV